MAVEAKETQRTWVRVLRVFLGSKYPIDYNATAFGLDNTNLYYIFFLLSLVLW